MMPILVKDDDVRSGTKANVRHVTRHGLKKNRKNPSHHGLVKLIYSLAILQLKEISVIVNKLVTFLLSEKMDSLVIKLIKRVS